MIHTVLFLFGLLAVILGLCCLYGGSGAWRWHIRS